METETEIVFKGVALQFEKILEQILFLLVSVSNSYEVKNADVLKYAHTDILEAERNVLNRGGLSRKKEEWGRGYPSKNFPVSPPYSFKVASPHRAFKYSLTINPALNSLMS